MQSDYKKTIIIILLITFLSLIPSSAQGQSSSPNIVIFLLDDAGFGQFAPYNGAIDYAPNMAALAETGTIYTRFYHSVALCVPTRYGLLTGRPPTDNPAFFSHVDDSRAIEESIVTLPERLSEVGYSTAIVGKWQLGERPEASPASHGFEYVSLAGTIPGLGLPEREYTTHKYTVDSVDFIRSTESPFFLYIAYSATHTPHFPIWEGLSGKDMIADSIQEIDWSIGEILRQIELKDELDNTLVIILSDNGPRQDPWIDPATGETVVPPGNPYAAWDPIYNNPARFVGGSNDNDFGWIFRSPTYDMTGKLIERTAKRSVYEAGVRIPVIIKWPTGISFQAQDDNLRWTGDIYATIEAMLGLVISGEGESLLSEPTRSHIEIYHSSGELGAIVEDRFKYHITGELYDLSVSVEEVEDVSSLYPATKNRLAGYGQAVYIPSVFGSPVQY